MAATTAHISSDPLAPHLAHTAIIATCAKITYTARPPLVDCDCSKTHLLDESPTLSTKNKSQDKEHDNNDDLSSNDVYPTTEDSAL